MENKKSIEERVSVLEDNFNELLEMLTRAKIKTTMSFDDLEVGVEDEYSADDIVEEPDL